MTRPRILMTTASSFRNHSLRRIDSVGGQNYAEAIAQAGGLPLLVSNLVPEMAAAFLESADGILFTGGIDVDPGFYGAEPHPELGVVDPARDHFELALYRAAKARNVPVLGICRGIQLINVAQGGTLHQHVPDLANAIQHEQTNIGGAPSHGVRLEQGSHLARAYGSNVIRTNSYHHQAVERLGEDLRVTARSSDGVVEAIEGTSQHYVLGVQWHPEMSFERYPEHFAPFKAFVDRVQEGQLVGA